MSSDDGVRRGSAGRAFVTFLLGLLLGAIGAVAAITLDLVPLDRLDAAEADPAGESPTPTAEEPAATAGEVPAPCLAAAEANATVSAALDGVTVGVRDADALAVEQGLDEIARIKPDMDAASQECRDLAAGGSGGDEADADGAGSGGEPADQPSPTSTP